MKEYLVSWTINIFANSPEEAARLAEESRNKYGLKAYEVSENVQKTLIDLDPD